ncbi:MAG: response regulator [Candidatus Portnoybacteria bacterium CG10_big_fil_rev_8_21_14_0_10_44_7]|uniref:Response regulator n=1 Tax=Candidatus Portnoybacteria bacterium CG10_big_fil_rev_8_21_14_0_10_44_7 TaxID=1974816 RepID=A0A2M8KI54_9BACT|nr:MAG: response regulator [Candidatus Portnoybacteria bacterium CG10_big_fil_rev_8_21_14_0_10_44_7]
MVKKLTDEGYAVSEAFDGQVGLKKVITDKPVLVLLDLILPGIDGFKLLEEIKSNPATADIPVIILSNLGQKEDIDRGLQLGAVDFMIKAHFTPNEIVGKIKNVLKGS